MMDVLWQDLLYAGRSLRKSPGFTLIALLVLALGIGANTAIFTVVNSVLLEPLPYEQPERIMTVMEGNPEAGRPRFGMSPLNFQDFRRFNRVFEEMTAFAPRMVALKEDGEPQRLAALGVSEGYFRVLGVRPVLGRAFLPKEDLPGSDRVAILSYGLWQRLYAGDRGAVGRTLILDGKPYTVVGVMPRDFKMLAETRSDNELWVPLALDYAKLGRGRHYLVSFARLKPGVTVGQARADLAAVASRLAQEYPVTNKGWTAVVDPLHERLVHDIRPALLMLLGAVGLVLLITCANLANLMLVRLARREREMAVRSALGARHGRLLSQLLSEAGLLSLGGGALGFLFAGWGVRALTALHLEALPRASDIHVDGRVLLFTIVLALLTTLLFGLLPARRAGRPELRGLLTEGGRSATTGVASGRLRSWLLAVEVALALVVSIGAGTLLRSFAYLQNISPGFEAENVLTLEIALPADRYPGEPEQQAFYRDLFALLGGIPGVEHAGAVSVLPLSDFSYSGVVSIEGRDLPPVDKAPVVTQYAASPDYFAAMGIPLVKGRAFTDADRAEAPPVAVVSQEAARRFWPGEDPVGKRITFDDLWSQADDGGEGIHWLTVVGVAGDVVSESLTAEGGPAVYYPYLQSPVSSATLVVRATGNLSRVTKPVRQAVWAVDGDLPVYNIHTLREHVDRSIARPRFDSVLLGVFAALALLLAALGIYGVVSYSVAQRLREIGVRMALGADRGRVWRLVVGRGMVPVAAGLGAGVVLALASSRVLSGLVFGIRPNDPWTIGAVVLILGAVALLASTLPSYRATRVDPLVALRQESL